MYRSLAEAVRDAESRGLTLSQIALEAESADSGRPVDDIRATLKRALDVMRGAVEQGLRGDLRSASGLVGGDAAKLRTGPDGPLAGTPFRDVLARALAVQEVNAAMGVIVAAPTAGGAGVLPAVLTGLADAKGLGDDALVDALATAAELPVPNEVGRAAAAEHDVRRQAERVEAILAAAARGRPA